MKIASRRKASLLGCLMNIASRRSARALGVSLMRIASRRRAPALGVSLMNNTSRKVAPGLGVSLMTASREQATVLGVSLLTKAWRRENLVAGDAVASNLFVVVVKVVVARERGGMAKAQVDVQHFRHRFLMALRHHFRRHAWMTVRRLPKQLVQACDLALWLGGYSVCNRRRPRTPTLLPRFPASAVRHTTSGDNHTRFRDDCFSLPGNLGKQGKRAKNESQKI
jgi:hypothetical protein